MRPFPILNPPAGCAKFVQWDKLDEKHAQRIHYQTLERLAERGGLGPIEVLVNLQKLEWNWDSKFDEAEAIAAVNAIAAAQQVA